MSREKRKLDHIKYALEISDRNTELGFEDVKFLHNCLSPVNPETVSIYTEVAGIKLATPIFIDAITGGTDNVTTVNRKLAKVAAATGLAMAVGSQYGTVKNKLSTKSYTVVRDVNPDGILFANVNALATPQHANEAVEMINAAALEIHLNVAQELLMNEGDKDFKAIVKNLKVLQDAITVPIIIKETGCGMAREQVEELMSLGFNCFNVAGVGGTSFPAIEGKRSKCKRHEKFADWGIPTEWSLIDINHLKKDGANIIASGGIRDGMQTAKALALGANAISMAGNVLKDVQKDVNKAIANINDQIDDLKDIMVLTGCKKVSDLKKVPLVFTGDTVNFIMSRGYDVAKISNKRK